MLRLKYPDMKPGEGPRLVIYPNGICVQEDPKMKGLTHVIAYGVTFAVDAPFEETLKNLGGVPESPAA